MVRYLTPNSTHAWMTRRRFSVAGAVAGQARQAARLRPAAVAIHDDGHVRRDAVGELIRQWAGPSAGGQTSMISVFFALADLVDLLDDSCRSASAGPLRPASDRPRRSASLSRTRAGRCWTSRRTLRTATRASSSRLWTTRTSSWRRSSVSGGMFRRMILPSLLGVRPRSEARMRFLDVLERWPDRRAGWSAGRGSGAEMVASCSSGVGVP